jgi:hypothetical protein
MPDFSIRQNDLRDPIIAVLKGATGAIVDLTTATVVVFQMADAETGAIKINAVATINSPPTAGVVQYDWLAGDTDTAGDYIATWQVTWPSGKTQTFPTAANLSVLVIGDLGP